MKREINVNPWNHITTTSKINNYSLDNYFTILIEKDGEYSFIVEEEQKVFDISQMPNYIKEDWIKYNKKPVSLSLLNEQIKNLTNDYDQFEEELSLLKSLTNLTQTYPGFAEVEDDNNEIFDEPIKELQVLIGDVKKNGSVTYNIQILLNTINQVSEKWNHDTRRIINLLEDSLEYLKRADSITTNKLSHSLDKLYIRLFSFYGNIYETLPRDNGFYLFEAGKNIERILSLISVLRSSFSIKNSADIEAVLMEAVLENHHLLAQYRFTYKSNLSLVTVLNLLFLEKNLPYTLSYLLDCLAECLTKLPKSIEPNRLSACEKSVLEASTLVKLMDAEKLVKVDEETGYRLNLDAILNQVEELISSVTIDLTGQYFNHSTEQYSILDTLEKSDSDEI
jgi:uncharacterized alpha-E superfamily protein